MIWSCSLRALQPSPREIAVREESLNRRGKEGTRSEKIACETFGLLEKAYWFYSLFPVANNGVGISGLNSSPISFNLRSQGRKIAYKSKRIASTLSEPSHLFHNTHRLQKDSSLENLCLLSQTKHVKAGGNCFGVEWLATQIDVCVRCELQDLVFIFQSKFSCLQKTNSKERRRINSLLFRNFKLTSYTHFPPSFSPITQHIMSTISHIDSESRHTPHQPLPDQ